MPGGFQGKAQQITPSRRTVALEKQKLHQCLELGIYRRAEFYWAGTWSCDFVRETGTVWNGDSQVAPQQLSLLQCLKWH